MVRSVDPRTGESFGPDFAEADPTTIDVAVTGAVAATRALARLDPARIPVALRAAAGSLDLHWDELANLADRETALGQSRLAGEVGRTTAQLRSFAAMVESGEHLDLVTSELPPGAPARELRRMNVPVGVVAVFAASNFPFAFSVAGGDTAAAVAAGCAVVVKAHHGHPQTSARVHELVSAALEGAGLPPNTLQLVYGEVATGEALVTHPGIAAVGFTGSTSGGQALSDLAARRPTPVPVYAEQGSLNPVVLAPSALSHPTAEGQALANSVALGAGQFCTKPGLMFAPIESVESLVAALTTTLADLPVLHLLTEKIHSQFLRATNVAAALPGVTFWRAEGAPGSGFRATPTVLTCDVATFVAEQALREELFGPATVVVAVADAEELSTALAVLDGNLTGTIHGDPADVWTTVAFDSLLPKVGRLVYGGVPTGVAVDPAMHHGGPYPASSSPLYTSVGTAAIRRFLRPVAFQDFPRQLLPAALR